jgi:hypothetical protein
MERESFSGKRLACFLPPALAFTPFWRLMLIKKLPSRVGIDLAQSLLTEYGGP